MFWSGESPCQFATCMNKVANIAEIIATCTSIKILQHNDIVENRRHDVVNRRHDLINRVNRTLANRDNGIVNRALDIVNREHDIANCRHDSMCFGTNGAP